MIADIQDGFDINTNSLLTGYSLEEITYNDEQYGKLPLLISRGGSIGAWATNLEQVTGKVINIDEVTTVQAGYYSESKQEFISVDIQDLESTVDLSNPGSVTAELLILKEDLNQNRNAIVTLNVVVTTGEESDGWFGLSDSTILQLYNCVVGEFPTPAGGIYSINVGVFEEEQFTISGKEIPRIPEQGKNLVQITIEKNAEFDTS